MKRTVGTLVTFYVLIGLGIIVAQSYTGGGCNVMMDEIYQVRANEPPLARTSGIGRLLLWPASFYANVWQRDVPIREFLSPSICVDKPSPSRQG